MRTGQFSHNTLKTETLELWNREICSISLMVYLYPVSIWRLTVWKTLYKDFDLSNIIEIAKSKKNISAVLFLIPYYVFLIGYLSTCFVCPLKLSHDKIIYVSLVNWFHLFKRHYLANILAQVDSYFGYNFLTSLSKVHTKSLYANIFFFCF